MIVGLEVVLMVLFRYFNNDPRFGDYFFINQEISLNFKISLVFGIAYGLGIATFVFDTFIVTFSTDKSHGNKNWPITTFFIITFLNISPQLFFFALSLAATYWVQKKLQTFLSFANPNSLNVSNSNVSNNNTNSRSRRPSSPSAESASFSHFSQFHRLQSYLTFNRSKSKSEMNGNGDENGNGNGNGNGNTNTNRKNSNGNRSKRHKNSSNSKNKSNNNNMTNLSKSRPRISIHDGSVMIEPSFTKNSPIVNSINMSVTGHQTTSSVQQLQLNTSNFTSAVRSVKHSDGSDGDVGDGGVGNHDHDDHDNIGKLKISKTNTLELVEIGRTETDSTMDFSPPKHMINDGRGSRSFLDANNFKYNRTEVETPVTPFDDGDEDVKNSRGKIINRMKIKYNGVIQKSNTNTTNDEQTQTGTRTGTGSSMSNSEEEEDTSDQLEQTPNLPMPDEDDMTMVDVGTPDLTPGARSAVPPRIDMGRQHREQHRHQHSNISTNNNNNDENDIVNQTLANLDEMRPLDMDFNNMEDLITDELNRVTSTRLERGVSDDAIGSDLRAEMTPEPPMAGVDVDDDDDDEEEDLDDDELYGNKNINCNDRNGNINRNETMNGNNNNANNNNFSHRESTRLDANFGRRNTDTITRTGIGMAGAGARISAIQSLQSNSITQTGTPGTNSINTLTGTPGMAHTGHVPQISNFSTIGPGAGFSDAALGIGLGGLGNTTTTTIDISNGIMVRDSSNGNGDGNAGSASLAATQATTIPGPLSVGNAANLSNLSANGNDGDRPFVGKQWSASHMSAISVGSIASEIEIIGDPEIRPFSKDNNSKNYYTLASNDITATVNVNANSRNNSKLDTLGMPTVSRGHGNRSRQLQSDEDTSEYTTDENDREITNTNTNTNTRSNKYKRNKDKYSADSHILPPKQPQPMSLASLSITADIVIPKDRHNGRNGNGNRNRINTHSYNSDNSMNNDTENESQNEHSSKHNKKFGVLKPQRSVKALKAIASLNKTKQKSHTSKSISLTDILRNEGALDLFMQHLSREFSIEIMIAFIEFTQFRFFLLDNVKCLKEFKNRIPKHKTRLNHIFYDEIPRSSIIYNIQTDTIVSQIHKNKRRKQYYHHSSHHSGHNHNVNINININTSNNNNNNSIIDRNNTDDDDNKKNNREHSVSKSKSKSLRLLKLDGSVRDLKLKPKMSELTDVSIDSSQSNTNKIIETDLLLFKHLRRISYELFVKYVAIGSIYEINISSQMRRAITKRIGNKDDWLNIDEYNIDNDNDNDVSIDYNDFVDDCTELVVIFEPARVELRKLLRHSFARLALKKEEFAKIYAALKNR